MDTGGENRLAKMHGDPTPERPKRGNGIPSSDPAYENKRLPAERTPTTLESTAVPKQPTVPGARNPMLGTMIACGLASSP